MLFFMCEMPKGLVVGESRDQSTKVQVHFVNRAVSYLEQCFKDLLQSTVNANLKQAKIGGAPGTLALVTGYLRQIWGVFFSFDQVVFWSSSFIKSEGHENCEMKL